jgi:phytoene dehydrogenase-like protein
METAVVVGAGPNGLAAAVTLARQGVAVTVLEAADTIGGGTRSSDLTGDGLIHDHCSAVHPLAIGSPFLREVDLGRYGVRWCQPEVDLAHPLDDGSAGVMLQSLTATAELLGSAGRRWSGLFGPISEGLDDLLVDVMRPLAHVPSHPLRLARYGIPSLAPAAAVARLFRTPQARALFGGVAAHAFHPLARPATAAIGLMLIAAGHRYGWVVAEGGSRSIADGLAKVLAEHGGTIETGVHVRSLAELPRADAVFLDLAPGAVAEVCGDRLPPRVARAYRRWRHGPGAFKVDLAVEGGIPWTNERCRQAGTVHLGGTWAEIAATERDIHAGRMPGRPFVLVGQQYLADPTRSNGDRHPVWSYAHVPHGYDGDATEAILAQFERFAPGTRERIVGMSVRPTTAMAAYNANYVGGDIITGANTTRQVMLRPRLALDPYRTGIPGVYICSAATPPGAGAHGMCGDNAARSALRAARRPSRGAHHR